MEENMKKLDGKVRMLAFLNEDIPRIQGKRDAAGIERQIQIMKKHLEETHDVIFKIQELKIESGDEPGEIREWSLQAEDNLSEYENGVETLKQTMGAIKNFKIQEEREEQEKLSEEKRKRQFAEELKLEEAKLKMKRDFERSQEESHSKAEKGQKINTEL
eukprot:gene5879-6568_t